MNHNSEGSPNARIGAGSTRDVVPFTAGRIEGWFRRPNHEQLNGQLNLPLEERRSEHARIAHKLHDSGMASTSLEEALSDIKAGNPGANLLDRSGSARERVASFQSYMHRS